MIGDVEETPVIQVKTMEDYLVLKVVMAKGRLMDGEHQEQEDGVVLEQACLKDRVGEVEETGRIIMQDQNMVKVVHPAGLGLIVGEEMEDARGGGQRGGSSISRLRSRND